MPYQAPNAPDLRRQLSDAVAMAADSATSLRAQIIPLGETG